MYTKDEVVEASIDYFDGDELAAEVFLKYALQDKEGNYHELTPDDMHKRMAKEFARIEKKYSNPMSEEEIYKSFKDFKAVVPQGSVMSGLGNNFQDTSLSNCNSIKPPEDTMSSIFNTARDMANLYKRRFGTGTDLSNLRPDGSVVNNSAKTSSGAWSFSDLYSYVTRMVGQCISEGELVLTKRGLVKIEEVKAQNDFVWTKVGWVKVDRVLCSGEKEVYRTTTKRGFSIKTSKDHIFAIERDKKVCEEKHENISVGDNIVLLPGPTEHSDNKDIEHFKFKTSFENISVLDENIAYLLGQLFGDGSVSRDKKGNVRGFSIQMSDDYPDMIDKVCNIIKNYANYEPKFYKHPERKSLCVRVHNSKFVSWMRDNNILKQLHHEIKIPECIYVSPPLVQSAFISGFLDADGTVKRRNNIGYIYSISSCAKEFVYDLQKILSGLGIVVSVHSEKPGKKGKRDMYYVNIGGASNTRKAFDILRESVKVQDNKIINRYDHCKTPFNAYTLGLPGVCELPYISTHTKHSVSINNFNKICVDKKVNLGNPLCTDTVKEVSFVGKENTYDLMLPEEHLFWCNGFYVHNSGRRGALMLTMDIRHPDIEKFITMKHDLNKVTGANISVKMRDDFMQAVKDDSEYILKWPVDSECPKVSRVVNAKDIWNTLVSSATKTAEPGIIFWDTILDNLPAECYADVGFRHFTTNPCSELPLSEDSCRLISNNLKHFVNKPFSTDASFDMDGWKKCVAMSARLADDLIDLELEKLSRIVEKADTEDEADLFRRLYKSCEEGRRTGIGTHGLADMLARVGLKYDSEEALELVEKVYRALRDVVYKTSIDLAEERGTFPVFDWEKEKDNIFIKRLPKSFRDRMSKVGRRGISLLTNAPTGSVSIMSQTSSGLEPVFKNTYVRRKKKNHSELPSDMDFVDQSGDRWTEFEVHHHNIVDWYEITKNDRSVRLPDFFVESGDINWEKRVELQAVMTSMIDHSISSTINLPKETTVDVVSRLYMKSWELKCKGSTVYVDGSRSGVLINKENHKEKIEYKNAVLRDIELDCDIHQATVKGNKWTILVGLVGDRPYEVFAGKSKYVEIPKKYKQGKIVKRARSTIPSKYDLQFGDDGVIKDIGAVFENEDFQTAGRLISALLRHSVAPNFIVEQLVKDKNEGLDGFHKVVSRVLKKYVKDGTKVSSDKTCSECNQESLIYESGCVICKSCSWSKCG